MSKELRQRVIFGLFFGLVSIYFLLTGGALFACFILIMAVVAMFEAVKILSNKDKKLSYQNLLQAGICVFVPCISIIYLRLSDGGIKWCLWLFVLIWTLDVFAYFGGKAIGGPKLAPSISPGKTVSGLVVGVLCSCISSVCLFFTFKIAIHFFIFLSLAILLPVLSQIGDLIESKFKRVFNVKDSGVIIPGHGGILDRMDGFLLTAPLLAIVKIFC